jgi:asparaginyl-tRNA synthetase
LNDGSSHNGLQVVVTANKEELQQLLKQIHTGTAIQVNGTLIKSPAAKQPTELQIDDSTADSIQILGKCDAETYPLQKKQHSIEFLRDNAHLRTRTNTGSAIIRVRNEAMMAIHEYFQENNFYHVHTPVITGSDCEGAGEQFRVLTDNELESKDKKEADKFFGTDVYLTVSGQLEAEIFATSMSRVYTFGPTFRAEPGKTSRHLAEFWMVEMEQSFVDLPVLAQHGENLVKHAIQRVMKKCEDELAFFNQWHDKDLLNRLKKTFETPFQRITYTEAIEILQKSGEKFEFPVEWGCNLQSEHEVYICKHFGVPTFVTHYPKAIKAFYARVASNEPGRETVAAFDLLVPNLGELIGGSEREERYDVLVQTLKEKGMSLEPYKWYLDLREFGSVPHGGFGIGFERLILYLTGISNIREAIPLPRAVGHCKF